MIALRDAFARALNPRYCWLAAAERRPGARILDVGAGSKDGRLAKAYWPGCWIEGVNIEPPPLEGGFDAYHQIDLNLSSLDFLDAASFDYVVSSHLIEHLQDGLKAVDQLADRVKHGGLLDLEWPSPASQSFPIRGLGLNFYDDSTHVRTYRPDDVVDLLRDRGFEILQAGTRRHWARVLFAPLLALRRCLALRRLVLYDFWDLTGFCLVVRARRV